MSDATSLSPEEQSIILPLMLSIKEARQLGVQIPPDFIADPFSDTPREYLFMMASFGNIRGLRSQTQLAIAHLMQPTMELVVAAFHFFIPSHLPIFKLPNFTLHPNLHSCYT